MDSNLFKELEAFKEYKVEVELDKLKGKIFTGKLDHRSYSSTIWIDQYKELPRYGDEFAALTLTVKEPVALPPKRIWGHVYSGRVAVEGEGELSEVQVIDSLRELKKDVSYKVYIDWKLSEFRDCDGVMTLTDRGAEVRLIGSGYSNSEVYRFTISVKAPVLMRPRQMWGSVYGGCLTIRGEGWPPAPDYGSYDGLTPWALPGGVR